MNDDIQKLMEAQNTDLEIDKLRKFEQSYPTQMQTLKDEISTLETNLADTIEGIKKNEANRGTIETEIAAERERLASRKQRLLITKTNKEYTAVQHEIVQSRERIDMLETEDIEIMTELDRLRQAKVEYEEKLEEVRKANTEKIAEIQEKYDSLESDIAVLGKKSERALDSIPPNTLAVYRRLRRSKSGVAIVLVDPVKLSCRGCFKQLPPQKILELRRHDKLMFCENCGRLLYWANNG